MCEEVTTRFKCGHEQQAELTCCIRQEAKRFDEQEQDREALSLGLPQPRIWCSDQNHLAVESKRLCADCRKERRNEMKVQEQSAKGKQWRSYAKEWANWRSKEAEEARAKRKGEEAALKRRWEDHNYGGVKW